MKSKYNDSVHKSRRSILDNKSVTYLGAATDTIATKREERLREWKEGSLRYLAVRGYQSGSLFEGIHSINASSCRISDMSTPTVSFVVHEVTADLFYTPGGEIP